MTASCFMISSFDHFYIQNIYRHAFRKGLLTLHQLCYKISDHIFYRHKFKYIAKNRMMFYFTTRKTTVRYLVPICIMVSGKWIECPKLHPSSAKLFCGFSHKSTDICSNLNNKYIYYLQCKDCEICPEHYIFCLNEFCITYNLLFYCLCILLHSLVCFYIFHFCYILASTCIILLFSSELSLYTLSQPFVFIIAHDLIINSMCKVNL